MPLLVIGATPARSFVELTDDEVRIRFGTAEESVPLRQIRDVVRVPWPWYYGLGVRLAPGGIGYVGSRKGVVHVRLAAEHSFRILFKARMSLPGFFLSLEDPDAFVADLARRLRSA